MRRYISLILFACVLPLLAGTPQLISAAPVNSNIMFSIDAPYADCFARLTASILSKQAQLPTCDCPELNKDIANIIRTWQPQTYLFCAMLSKDAAPGCCLIVRYKNKVNLEEIQKLLKKHDPQNKAMSMGIKDGKLILMGGFFTIATANDNKILIAATSFHMPQILADLNKNTVPAFAYKPAQKIPATSRCFGFIDDIEPFIQLMEKEKQAQYLKYSVSNLVFFEEKVGDKYVAKASFQCKDTEGAQKMAQDFIESINPKARVKTQGNTIYIASEPYSLNAIDPQQEKMLEDTLLKQMMQNNTGKCAEQKCCPATKPATKPAAKPAAK